MRTARLDTLLAVEDRRGRGEPGVEFLESALADRDSLVREYAVRGLGRLEQPLYARHVAPLLGDSSVAVRAASADAVAQSFARVKASPTLPSADPSVRTVAWALDQLRRAGAAERDPSVLDAIARSAGRLPFSDPRQVGDAAELLRQIGGRAASAQAAGGSDEGRAITMQGVAEGFYSLARGAVSVGAPSAATVALLDTAASFGLDRSAAAGDAGREATARVRRLALTALTALGSHSPALLRRAWHDPDVQVRRLALAALPDANDLVLAREGLAYTRTDSAFQVRLEWVRRYRQLLGRTDCAPLVEALGDPDAHVRLAAIDALGGDCPPTDGVSARLEAIADSADGPGRSWHARAHALAALARIDLASALPRLARAAADPVWEVRMYAARGAASAHDTATLARLAFDRVGSVREAAIDGMARVSGHAADLVYLRALRSPDYPVVLAAARALKGTRDREQALPALMDALDRLTAEHRETSHDPRQELLTRIVELADSATPATSRLEPYARDFDSAIADLAGSFLEATRFRVRPRPSAPPPLRVTALGAVALGPTPRLRVTMASGAGRFVIRLDNATTPASTERIVSLARRHYYDGLSWHRVVPNFVVQGGSPGMNEYVGDSAFMRDEVGLAHHLRGAVGISTRGRDTGDAQLFIDLVDNDRLDHEYTVVGVVESGMDVVDRILEGDRMATVEVLPP